MSTPPIPAAVPGPDPGGPSAAAEASEARRARAVDARLSRLARAGDTGAFGELVRVHQVRVFHLARRLLGDGATAQDLTQEAFLRAFEALDRFKEGEPFRPWLNTIVVNLCLNEIERRRRASRMLGLARQAGSGAAGRAPLARPPAGSPEGVPGPSWTRPDAVAQTRELERRLEEEIAALPVRYRAAFLLRHREGLDVAAIARALPAPVGTVKTLLFRARERLRRRLGDDL